MNFPKLCPPAMFYFVVSAIIMILSFLMNFNYIVSGFFRSDRMFIKMIFDISYVLIWTFMLNCVCAAGYKNVAWFFVLFPIVLSVVLTVFEIMALNSAVNDNETVEALTAQKPNLMPPHQPVKKL